jgi:hypothetical protein
MEEPRTTLRRSNPLPIVLVVLAAAGALAFFGWRFWRRSRPPEAPAASAPAGPAAPAAPPEGEPPGEAVDPATADALVAAVSQHELYRRALAEGDLVARAALVVDNLREGVSPRRPLAFLAPAKPFAVVERDGRSVIAPAAYARYDAFADAVASVDAERLARAYRAIRAPLAAAYRALGHPDARLDAAVARGLERIEGVALADGDVAVRDEEGVWVFEDGRLEALPEVEKHLLRMGPRNGRILQAKARELRAALALPRQGGARAAP